jgi:guanyl-specific ribonuclease Sa
MTGLSPELAAFASLLDAQPAPVRAMFNYCLASLMVEAGKARLVETVPGENGPVCTFETITGEQLSLSAPVAQAPRSARRSRGRQVARPAMTKEMEAEVREVLKEILEEEGGR